jgi:hypothetical protein
MLQTRDAERSNSVFAVNNSAETVEQALGSRLKTFFDGVVASPIPDKIQQLAKALEDALDRGDLRPQDLRRGHSPRL